MPRERNDAIYKRVLEGMGPRTVKAAPLPPDVTFAPKIAPRSVALAAKRNAAEPMTVEARLSRQAVATSDKVKVSPPPFVGAIGRELPALTFPHSPPCRS